MPGACSTRRPATAPWSWRLETAVVEVMQIRCRFSARDSPLRGCWRGVPLNQRLFNAPRPVFSPDGDWLADRDSAGVERFAPGGWSDSPRGGGAIRPSRRGPYGWDRPLPRQFRIPRTSPAGRETQSSARRPGLDPARGEPPRSGPERVAQAGRARPGGVAVDERHGAEPSSPSMPRTGRLPAVDGAGIEPATHGFSVRCSTN
jgi:hypothetical protein